MYQNKSKKQKKLLRKIQQELNKKLKCVSKDLTVEKKEVKKMKYQIDKLKKSHMEALEREIVLQKKLEKSDAQYEK